MENIKIDITIDRILILFAVLLGAVIIFTRLLNFVPGIEISGGQEEYFGDFRVYHKAINDYFDGKDIYNLDDRTPYLYPPFFLLFMVFFSFFTLKTASIILLIINFVFTVLICMELRKELGSKNKLFLNIALVSIWLSHPWLETITWGQINIIISFFLLLVYVNITKGKLVSSSIYATISGFMKLIPFASVLYSLKTKMRIRYVVYFCLSFLLLLLISILIFGVDLHIEYINTYLNYSSDRMFNTYNNSTLMKIILYYNLGNISIPYYAFFLGLFSFIYIYLKDRTLLFLAVIFAPLLFTKLVWSHYFIFFIPFLVMLLFHESRFNRYLSALIIFTLNLQSYAVFLVKKGVMVDLLTIFSPATISFALIIILLTANALKEFCRSKKPTLTID